MIQFNLLPDVKIEYIKAHRTKRIVTLVSIGASAAALAIMLLMIVNVDVVQKKSLSNLDKDITKYSNSVKGIPDLSKVLTVQNQLKTLTSLHDQKPVASRLFTYITQVTPPLATISHLNISYTANTLVITGEAPSLDIVNSFTDALKATAYVKNIVNAKGNWKVNTSYQVADVVQDGGVSYQATVAQLSSAATEPGVGANWQTSWTALSDASNATGTVSMTGVWHVGVTYKDNDVVQDGSTFYQSSADQVSSSSTEPGVGTNWQGKWILLPKAFTGVVLSSFGRDSKGATYTISFSFDPIIFNNASNVTLAVPNITTNTGTLFQSQATK